MLAWGHSAPPVIVRKLLRSSLLIPVPFSLCTASCIALILNAIHVLLKFCKPILLEQTIAG